VPPTQPSGGAAAPGIQATILDEVLANLFQAIVDEMASATLRSAYTTFVKETQDFGTGLISTGGEMFTFPSELGAKTVLGIPLQAGVDPAHGWEPGDILIANDPYRTSGMVTHLNDLYMFKPIFADGEVIAFAWGFLHCTDVGGAVPGSITFASREIYQEGLRLRPVKLYRRGVLNTAIRHIIEDNCRIPDDNWGDISALAASLTTGEKRVGGLVAKYGEEAVQRAIEVTLGTTERRARNALRMIPAGEYRFIEYFEDDYISDVPVRVEVCLHSAGDGNIVLDFTGSDPAVRSALNIPSGSQKHHPFVSRAIVNFVGTYAPGIRLNAGVLRAVELVLPAGSVVNGDAPRSCGLRIGTALKAHDAVLGCLAQAVPERVPAAGAGQVVITYVSAPAGLGKAGRVVVANPVQGGSGGGLGMDGVSGADRPTAFLHNVPAEVLEAEAPVIVRRYGLSPDSEGPGRYRGGFGIRFSVELTQPGATLVLRGQDRHVFNPWGVRGGRAGSNATCVSGRGGEQAYLGKANLLEPGRGEVVTVAGAGGGGYGDPLERDPGKVCADARNGLVSIERARDVYGVVLAGVGPLARVDEEATAALRDAGLQARPATGSGEAGLFDYGPGRTAWTARYGAVTGLISRWVWSLPDGIRADAKTYAYTELARRGPGPYTEADALDVMKERQ